MSEIQSKLLEKLRAKVAKTDRAAADGPADSTGPDERDATIARLERELEAEREHAAELRKKIDEQGFRIEVLEQSYSKQLGDARARAENAETALAAEKARSAALESSLDTLTAERDAAQKELDQRMQRDRASLSFGPSTAPGQRASLPRPADRRDDRELSIDDMLADASVVDSRDQADPRAALDGPSATDAPPEDDLALEDMLSPDLVFNDKDRQED